MSKYFSLKIVAFVLSLLGFFFLIVSITEVTILFTLSEYKTLRGNEFLEFADRFIDTFLVFKSIGVIVWGIVLFIIFQAISQQIKVFIDIEYNTRMNRTLSESKLDVLREIHKIQFKLVNSMTCPRCLGKGYVDSDDIRRLDVFGWEPGHCIYCDSTGSVQKKATLENNVTDYYESGNFTEEEFQPYVAETEKFDNNEATIAGAIIALAMFLYVLTANFKFNLFLLVISLVLFYLNYKKEDSYLKKEYIPQLLFGLSACLMIGVIFRSLNGNFQIGPLVLVVLSGLIGMSLYHKKEK